VYNVDDAISALRNIQSEFAAFCAAHGQVSESDTRVKLIDRVLKDVCGWPESSITREEHTNRGYLDYTLSLPTRRVLVVEAKREGIPFVLPATSHQKTFKLSGGLFAEPRVHEAIQQVRGYCDDTGTRYALATNGYSWIVFRAIRDDIPWREGKAHVFPSLEYIAAHFAEFVNLLSLESVCAGSLEQEFGTARRAPRNLFRAVDFLYNADLPLQRNTLHAQLDPVIRSIFEDIAEQDSIEVLQSCYVHGDSLRIVAEDLDCVITDSIPRFLRTEGTEPLFTGSDAWRFDRTLSAAANRARGELFLILGGIGSGKSTFIKRYQREVGKDLLDGKTLWFHIDFLKAPGDPMDLEDFAWRDVLNQLRHRYQPMDLETRRNLKRVFAGDIQVLRQTALRAQEGSDEYERVLSGYLEKWQQNLPNYVPGLLRLCKTRRKLPIVLFIDNVDQLSSSYQAQIFLLAQRLTRVVDCLTIVTLREESYYAASVQKTFNAYSNRKFHIASPPFRGLVGSRIDFALKVLQRPDSEMQVILTSGIALDRSAIADFLRIVQRSIFQQNPSIARFIESICFGNMRLALQMFTTFLTSGATDVDKMLHIYRRDGSYYVAYHEFVKSIILGDRQYYKEQQSPIMNVFDCGAQRNSSHFTALRLANVLGSRRREATAEGQGYAPISEILSLFEESFDNLEDCVRGLTRMVGRQLVELNSRSTETIAGARHARLTSAGWYYRRYLAKSFPYLDLVLQDTPVDDATVEQELRRKIAVVGNLSDRDDQKVERMRVRFERVALFLDYLRAEEQTERKEWGLDRLAGPIAEAFVPRISEAFEQQRDWIRRRHQENRERYADETFIDDTDASDGEGPAAESA
jgi:hypothetical protein